MIQALRVRVGRTRFHSRVSAAALLGALFVQSAAFAQALSLAEALRLAEQQAPQLTAQRLSVEASEQLVASARELPDPKLTLGIDNLPIDGADRFSVARDFMTMRKLGVMQEFPHEEKRRLRGERAQAEAGKEAATLAALATTLRRDVAQAWLERYASERQLAVLREMAPEAQLAIEAAQAQLASGKGTLADPFIAKLAQSQLQDRTADAERQVRRAKAMLARYVGADAERPLAQAPDASQLPDSPDALLRGIEHHPELATFVPAEAIAKAELGLAQAAKKPDWSLELAYAQRGSSFSNMVSLMVRVDLPWWSERRQDPVIAAKQKMLEQVQAQREDTRRMHEAELNATLADWQAASERLARYERELIPLARERTQAALASYRAGKGDLMPVVEARRAEIDTSLSHVQVQTELARAWAYLSYLIPQDHTHRKQP